MTNPLLAGIRVIDVSRLLPGPYCSLVLAQLGAEVIKIEEPQGGDYLRDMEPQLFALVNRGKRSVALDLRKADDVKVFGQLVQTADVVLESFRPGVMDRLGCGYAALKALNPRLVYAALTGYGQDGPYRDRAGHDLNYLAESGVLEQTGRAGDAPGMCNVPVADLAAGALHCATGILAAVLGARASGVGAFLDSAMFDGSLALNLFAMSTLRSAGVSQPRGTAMLNGGVPRYAIYECADGAHFALGSLEPKFWAGFCAAVQRNDLLDKGGDAQTGIELQALFRTRTRDQWQALLGPADICASAVLKPEEALTHPQLVARNMIESSAGGPAAAAAIRYLDVPLPPLPDAPALGEGTREILDLLR